MNTVSFERNQDATLYAGNLDEKVTDALLWELFTQMGPVLHIHLPKDRISQSHQGYGFVEFQSEQDADYALKIMNMIKLYGKPIRVNKASADKKNLDVGANLFIGNLSPEVDEKLLYDTFSAFGVILQTPKIMREVDSGSSKGFAFINFSSFEAADAALEAMNGQFLCNRAISISYAFKKDGKGERHGSAAERLLAAQNPVISQDRPHNLFSDNMGNTTAHHVSTGLTAFNSMMAPRQNPYPINYPNMMMHGMPPHGMMGMPPPPPMMGMPPHGMMGMPPPPPRMGMPMPNSFAMNPPPPPPP
eukprot:Sdes_comp19751_c0_seq1m11782